MRLTLYPETNQLKVIGWEKIYHSISNQQRAWLALLISYKRTLNQKLLQETMKDIIHQ